MPNYFAYAPEQAELLPRRVRDELPKGHLCFLIPEVIEGQDLSGFDRAYSEEGQKAYNPRMMLKVWLYAFAVTVRSTHGRRGGQAGQAIADRSGCAVSARARREVWLRLQRRDRGE